MMATRRIGRKIEPEMIEFVQGAIGRMVNWWPDGQTDPTDCGLRVRIVELIDDVMIVEEEI